MTRLTDLQTVRRSLVARMKKCESDQNYVVMGRLLADVVKQIDEIDPATGKPKETGLSDFEKRLRAREQRTKNPRRAKSG